MSVEDQFCPICRFDATKRSYHANDTVTYQCRRCGKFGLTGSAEAMCRNRSPEERSLANASAWIWEHQGVMLYSDDLGGLFQRSVPTTRSAP